MYSQPPLIASISVAAVVGTATGVILAAPGLGSRYRIVGCQLSINRTSGAANVDLALIDAAANSYAQANGLTLNGTTNVVPQIPEPGLVVPENVDLRLQVVATAVGGSGRATVYYFQDVIS